MNVNQHQPFRVLIVGGGVAALEAALTLRHFAGGTRLITRSRGAYDCLAVGLMLTKVLWRPLDFGMQRRQLLNLKRLVEAAT
jgi:pyruvate/2-oxoglutarate dehydrogenase complex dihydrolipoamide dehydrogenase (E3) component